MPDLHIRDALEIDLPAMLDIFKTSVIASYGGFLNAEGIESWRSGGKADAYMQQALPRTVVGEAGGEVVAFAALDGDFVELLWVRLERRGTGIGSRMMDALEARIAATGHPTARLECFVPNTPSIAFYEHRGYTIERTYFVDEAGVDTAVMIKNLARAP